MQITIAIPNYNGEKLLKRNLPNILGSGADEVLIIDDGSKDNSVAVLSNLKRNYKLKVLTHETNKGFIPSVNELFDKASGDIVILLNNDVWVEQDFLKPLIKHFENPKVFAVNLHEEGEGPSRAFWKDGFFEFKRGEEKERLQKSAWASGGSAAFRKSIWEELGGFDGIYAPFYWEDAEISFRALKKGYEILWEPQSRVKHQHETTIKNSFSLRYVRWVQQRNQLLFIWKNIKDPQLIREHRIGLFKRLFSSGLGYCIPYLWALSSSFLRRQESNKLFMDPRIRGDDKMWDSRTDLEAINYAGS